MSKVLFIASPTLNSYVDRKKGTTGNRFDCAGHHFANACKYNAALAGTVGLAGAVGYARAGKAALNGGFLKNAATIFKAVPAPIKLAAGVALTTLIAMKHYNIGKIEQRFDDRAEFVRDVDRSNNAV